MEWWSGNWKTWLTMYAIHILRKVCSESESLNMCMGSMIIQLCSTRLSLIRATILVWRIMCITFRGLIWIDTLLILFYKNATHYSTDGLLILDHSIVGVDMWLTSKAVSRSLSASVCIWCRNSWYNPWYFLPEINDSFSEIEDAFIIMAHELLY